MVAAIHPWNRQVFQEEIAPLPGSWTFIGSKEEMTLEAIRRHGPAYIFFLHWSWKVPSEIVKAYQCIVFHMTDVPYGRGGSPLQNLILRGHTSTKLTAMRMTEEMDAGPVYLKEALSLDGSAQEIYERASRLAAKMIRRIITDEVTPAPQQGEATVFRRRRPEESEVPEMADLEKLYNFIRMLDAEGYPRAFLRNKGYRYEFSQASLEDGQLRAKVRVTPAEAGER
jgi:methionyl-tRNA formyltransferase